VNSGDNVVAIGWGTYAEEYNYTAYTFNHLQQAIFTINDQNDELCNHEPIGSLWDKNKTICAQGLYKVTCYGDSGGPVLFYRHNRWTLVGIISFAHDIINIETNEKRCNASMPFYFVKVASYYNWINTKTNYSLEKYSIFN
jgi:secreted trypsin-like serine protease